jgi:hypothetical protein
MSNEVKASWAAFMLLVLAACNLDTNPNVEGRTPTVEEAATPTIETSPVVTENTPFRIVTRTPFGTPAPVAPAATTIDGAVPVSPLPIFGATPAGQMVVDPNLIVAREQADDVFIVDLPLEGTLVLSYAVTVTQGSITFMAQGPDGASNIVWQYRATTTEDSSVAIPIPQAGRYEVLIDKSPDFQGNHALTWELQ